MSNPWHGYYWLFGANHLGHIQYISPKTEFESLQVHHTAITSLETAYMLSYKNPNLSSLCHVLFGSLTAELCIAVRCFIMRPNVKFVKYFPFYRNLPCRAEGKICINLTYGQLGHPLDIIYHKVCTRKQSSMSTSYTWTRYTPGFK